MAVVTRVIARSLRDDRGRHLQHVLSDSGGAAGCGGDGDVVEEGRKDVGVERLPGWVPAAGVRSGRWCRQLRGAGCVPIVTDFGSSG